MRRNAARIGLVGVLALSMGVATATAPPARADDPTSLIAPARSSAGLMNYAINLSPGASPAELERALALVPSAHGVALASYPQIGTFFAQSESASFAPDIAEALAGAGIKVHSVGPTRVAPVPEGERAAGSTPGDKPAPEPTAPQSGQGGAQSGPQSGAPSGGTNSVRDHDATEAEGEEDISNWGAAAMSAREAGAVPVAHAPVTVGVIDTGIDDMHPDLAGRVDQTRSVSCAANGIASQGYGSWRDDYFHGTHVAGIIAANHNSIGIDGIAPQATLVSIKAANSEQLMYPEYVTCGFMWAASHGVDIVNNSYSMDPWMYWSPTDPEQAAGLEAASRSIAYAQGSGLAVIASAGNEGADNDNPTTDSASPTDVDTPIKDRPVAGSIRVPGQVAGVSQVSALKRVNEETKPEWTTLARADFSNYGTTIDFAAPGEGIYSTVPTSQYASGYAKTSGTSMAAPHITGIAALIKATHPAFTGAQIVDLMRKQAAIDYTRLDAPTDGKEYRGHGFINALTTMRRDQMRPTVTTLEYRVGKGEWKNLDGAVLPAGPVTFYASAASPISHLHMDVAGLTAVDRDGSGKYGDDELGVSAENVDLSSLLPEGADSVTARVQVRATGINFDRQADDDTGREATFTVSRDPAVVPQPAPDPADNTVPAPATPTAGITAPARAAEQLPANYAVNLPKGADKATFERAAAQASFLGGLVLARYPQFGTFFVQSASPSFSPDLGAALIKEGISYDSIGPTRQAPVGGNEAVVPVDYTTLARANAALAASPKADGAQGGGVQDGGAQGGNEAGVTPDPQTSNGWHLQALRALEAQGVDVMRAPVTVGVMDQSIDDTVPDLAGQVDHSKSVACNVNGIPNQDPAAWRWDDATHGTHVAGSIAAKHDGVGVDGVNPTLKIAAINVASRNGGYFYPEYIACGFVWAAEHGISVTNGSYYVNPWKYWMPGDPEQAAGLEAVQRAVDYSTSKDVINVVAAGNWTTDLDNPPATDDSSPGDTWGAYERDVKGGVYLPSMMRGTLAVSALQLPDGADPATGVLEPTSWSNWGASTIDFAAPGAKIYAPLTSWYGKAYGNLYGTSQAAPLAAAVLSGALCIGLWARWPRVSIGGLSGTAAAAVLALFVLRLPLGMPTDAIVMLDVGQGDAFLVRSGANALLIDTGNQDSLLKAALARQRVGRLDAVAVTHSDDDHCGSLSVLGDVAPASALLVPEGLPDCSCKACSELMAAARTEGLADALVELSPGDTVRCGKFSITVLWPERLADDGGNADSLCLLASWDGDGDGAAEWTALFTGDAEAEQLDQLTDKLPASGVEVLKVGHHGSKKSLDASLAERLSPKVALIGVGEANRYGHPSQNTLDFLEKTGCATYCSDESGDVVVAFSEDTLTVSTQR